MTDHSPFDAPALPSSLHLLAACCEYPQTAQDALRLEQLASQIADWQAFHQASRRHQVQGFVHESLGASNHVPSGIRGKWADEARQRVSISFRQAKATGELHALLMGGGVDNVILKGLPLAVSLYDSLTIKRSSDIDILIREDQAAEALELLAREGFVALATRAPLSARQIATMVRHYKEITLCNDQSVVVDLHWRLVDNPVMLKGIEPFENTRHILIDKVGQVEVLGSANEFAYLCAHGALSDWSRLKWLCDVNALINQTSDDDVSAYVARAQRLNAGPSAAQALRLREIIWSKPVPKNIAGQLGEHASAPLVRYPIDRLTEPYRPVSSRAAIKRIARQTMIRSKLYNSWMMAVAELRSHLIAVPDVLVAPLPPRLDFLYVLLRPAFWLMRKVGRGKKP